MQNSTKFAFSAVAAAAVLALAACGGGGGDAPAASAPATTTPPPAPAITVQGTAPAVTADPLAVVFVPQNETSTRTTQQSIAWSSFPANLQKASAEGAYTTLGIDTNSLITLSSGKIVDVAGNGEFAIGRWTDGSSNLLGSISSNQGAHYAVGKPLTLIADRTLQPDLSIGPKLTCSNIAATSPTAVSGNFAPGKLNSATATISLSGPTLDSFSLDVGIGSDAHATAAVPFTILSGVTISNGVAQHIQVLGSSQNSPYLAIGYAFTTPSSGDVSGVVVLKCTNPTGPV